MAWYVKHARSLTFSEFLPAQQHLNLKLRHSTRFHEATLLYVPPPQIPASSSAASSRSPREHNFSSAGNQNASPTRGVKRLSERAAVSLGCGSAGGWWREGGKQGIGLERLAEDALRCLFSKVLCIGPGATLCSKYSRALTFESFYRLVLCRLLSLEDLLTLKLKP